MRHHDRRCRALAYSVVLSVLLSCGDEDGQFRDLPPITWRGSHIEFGSDVDAEICPATLPSENEYMEGVDEYVRSNTAYPIRYYHLREDLSLYGFGCAGYHGCVRVDDGAVVIGSRQLSLRHELIHASSIGGKHSVLEEGLATFLGNDAYWWGIAEPLDVRAAFDSVDGKRGGIPAEFYPVAGHFVSFLVEAHGLPAVVALVDASTPGMTLDELSELSVETLGEDLRLALDEYEASGPGCEVAQYAPTWFQCELTPPSIPIFSCTGAGEAVDVDVALSCADGASGVQDGMIWRDVLIDAPRSLPTLVRVYEGHPVELVVRSCGQGCSTPLARLASEMAEEHTIAQPFELREGLNLVRILKPVATEGRVRLGVNLLCP